MDEPSTRSRRSVGRQPTETGMAIASIHRRLGVLETVMAEALAPEYPSLTPSEVDTIARRVQSGGRLTKTELGRLERQSPIIDGELLMTCHKGHVTAKRYVGVDLAEI
jgi:hypothetical protein